MSSSCRRSARRTRASSARARSSGARRSASTSAGTPARDRASPRLRAGRGSGRGRWTSTGSACGRSTGPASGARLSSSTSSPTSSVIAASSCVAVVGGERSRSDRRAEEDLDVHLVVAAIDPGGVVDRVGVDQTAVERVLDPPALGEAEIAALADDPAAQLDTVDAQRVVGPVTDLGVGLRRRLDVRADPAVPEQVDRGAQHRRHQLGRRERRAVDPEPLGGRAR